MMQFASMQANAMVLTQLLTLKFMNEQRHILSSFDKALNHLHEDLLRMASLTVSNLNASIRSLVDRNADMANHVIAEDNEVDQLEKSIDADGIAILTKFNPVARDLRRVLSTMKASSNFERISDQAVNIARRAKRLMQSNELSEARLVESIYALALSLLQDAIRAFREEDLELAMSLKPRDKDLDRQQNELINKITLRMEEDGTRVKDYVDLIFIIRFLERAGDHAVNVGEDAVYASSARDIRHIGVM